MVVVVMYSGEDIQRRRNPTGHVHGPNLVQPQVVPGARILTAAATTKIATQAATQSHRLRLFRAIPHEVSLLMVRAPRVLVQRDMKLSMGGLGLLGR